MDLEAFVRYGYVAIRGAVDAGTVAACRELIWAAMERRGVRRDDPGSWTAPIPRPWPGPSLRAWPWRIETAPPEGLTSGL
jgi:hypothetical protein